MDGTFAEASDHPFIFRLVVQRQCVTLREGCEWDDPACQIFLALKHLNLHDKYARLENEATTGQKDRTRAGKCLRFLF
jgi:hypothetical protein